MSTSKKLWIAGWVISALMALVLMGPSAMGKLTDWEGKEKMLAESGFTVDLMKKIGILEIAIAVVYLIPQSSFLGAILLTGYLGGAVVTDLRVGQSFIAPIIIGVLVWVGLALRRPEIWRLTLGGGTAEKG